MRLRTTHIFLIMLMWLLAFTGCKSAKYWKWNAPNLDEEVWFKTKYEKEWWYLTGWLTDSSGNLYFHQFTIFHGTKLGFEGYASHMVFTDYSQDFRRFEEFVSRPNETNGINGKQIWMLDDTLTRTDSSFHISANITGVELKLHLTKNKTLVKHGENGIIWMGKNSGINHAAYQSYTDLTAEGYVLDSLNQLKKVHGHFWYDRQFGNFKELYWNWYSLRLFDSTQYMFYQFPKTGDCGGNFIDKKGRATILNDLIIRPIDSTLFKPKNKIFPTTSTIQLSSLNKYWTIKPIKKDEFNINKIGPIYWEGLCYVYDENDLLVGYAVVELTSP